MSKLHFLPNEKLYFQQQQQQNPTQKKKKKKPNGKPMKDALIGIVLNKV